MSLQLHHHLSKVEQQGDLPATLTDAEIRIEFGRSGAMAQLCASKKRPPARLFEAVTETFASLKLALPPGFEKDLWVESGIIAEELFLSETVVGRTKRPYTLAACRGMVLALEKSLGVSTSSPWKRTVSHDQGARALPLVLGPSAALAVLAHWIEFSTSPHRELPANGKTKLRFAESYQSPYPPHTALGLGLGKKYSGSADLKKKAASFEAVKPLLVRQDLWSRPLSALFHDGLRHWTMSCDDQVSWPPHAVILDALAPLECGSQVIDWEAVYSLRGEDGHMAGVGKPVRVRFEPRTLIGRVRGSIGQMMPGYVDDPIAGKQYGLATPLACDVLLSEILSEPQ